MRTHFFYITVGLIYDTFGVFNNFPKKTTKPYLTSAVFKNSLLNQPQSCRDN